MKIDYRICLAILKDEMRGQVEYSSQCSNRTLMQLISFHNPVFGYSAEDQLDYTGWLARIRLLSRLRRSTNN